MPSKVPESNQITLWSNLYHGTMKSNRVISNDCSWTVGCVQRKRPRAQARPLPAQWAASRSPSQSPTGEQINASN
jgi:hypothetical protein